MVSTTLQYDLCASIEEMLAPEMFSKLENRPVKYVRCLPFKSEDSKSGSRFLRVDTHHSPDSQYIVKRVSLAWDWLMRATEDYQMPDGAPVAVRPA